MPRPKVLALVMAGGEGSRLELLTERRAKPALPYAGVYRLDYGEVLSRHRERGAGVTVVTSEAPEREASRQAVVEVAGDGRLSGFPYKSDEPPTTRVATEVFAFATPRLLDTLEELAGEGELQDFGHGLLPRPVEAGEAVEHRMAGYGRDVEGSARLEGAPLSPGSVVYGELTRSVLGPGVVVEPGAAVRDAVPLDDCVVAGDAREEAHVPRGATVAPGGRLGQHGAREPAA